MTILAVFRSRAQALDFVSALKGAGVVAQAVNTPQEAGTGCGLSVRFEERFLSRARMVLSGRSYSAFSGFMRQNGLRSYYL